MRQRWFSKRSLKLHLGVALWVPACLIAGWWQVNRAFDGNGLSYVYSVEWPIFALLGIWGWWVFVHADPQDVGAAAQRRLETERPASATEGGTDVAIRQRDDEDAQLAAYNDRLAELAQRGPKTWRNT